MTDLLARQRLVSAPSSKFCIKFCGLWISVLIAPRKGTAVQTATRTLPVVVHFRVAVFGM